MSAEQREYLAARQFIRRVREHARDYPQLNTLVSGEEHSNSQIVSAMRLTLSRINSTPPDIGSFGVSNVPESILMDGVIAMLLESAYLILARNDLAFQAGGASVQRTQVQSYLMMSRELFSRFTQEMRLWKIAMNHEMAIAASGGIFSEMLVVNRPTRSFWMGDPSSLLA